jgi:ABC-type sugar transport system substrate-binding protein
MRQFGRFALALATAGLIGTGLAGESRAHAAEANIWYVNPLPNTPDWGRSGKLFQDGAKANGYKATLTGPSKIDIPAMVSQIEQAIADGADGIITCPLDPAAFKGVIDKAKGKGIVVASIGCVDPNATFSVGTGNDQYGRVSADLVAQRPAEMGRSASSAPIRRRRTRSRRSRAFAKRSRPNTPISRS